MEQLAMIYLAVDDFRSRFVGFSIKSTALNVCTTHDYAPRFRPMVSTVVQIDIRSPAELAEYHDQGLIEQSTVSDVLHKVAKG